MTTPDGGPMTNTRASLYRKIAAVTKAVGRVPKNGRNEFHKYAYATESDITDALRDVLADNGLAFLPPTVVAWERSELTTRNGGKESLTRVQMQFGLADTETGEQIDFVVWGEGQDAGDKSFYKAYTGAVKYALMKSFLVATGDDPEAEGPADKTPATQQRPAAARQQAQRPAAGENVPAGRTPDGKPAPTAESLRAQFPKAAAMVDAAAETGELAPPEQHTEIATQIRRTGVKVGALKAKGQELGITSSAAMTTAQGNRLLAWLESLPGRAGAEQRPGMPF